MTEVDIVVEGGDWAPLGDLDALAARAVEAARAVLPERRESIAITILFTDDARIRVLNRTWRGKDAPTNVLSFPSAPAPHQTDAPRELGDIALACETLTREAAAEGKSLADHATHLIVHGVLHLFDYDHATDAEAGVMEALEVRALARLGLADPYRDVAA